MIRNRTWEVIEFLRHTVQEEGEDLRQARRFVQKLGEFSELEQLVLDCALKSRKNLSEFCTAFRA